MECEWLENFQFLFTLKDNSFWISRDILFAICTRNTLHQTAFLTTKMMALSFMPWQIFLPHSYKYITLLLKRSLT